MHFIFAVHNHQPVGNFAEVLEKAYQTSYLPFLKVLERYPGITFSMHTSGPLLDWLELEHPEYLDSVAALVELGRVEILAAGYYEPILASIPEEDRIEQITLMADYAEHRFGHRPRGLWLTERIWEPSLAKTLCKAGIRYVAVDDYHFSTSGRSGAELDGYFLTEDEGHTLAVFPISQQLRYAIPFEPPGTSLAIFRKHDREGAVMVMADDGEKFGVWPRTAEKVFGRGRWLERFCTQLEKHRDWLQTTTFSAFLDRHAPLGRVYLPTSSYFEMSEWTLPTALGRRYEHHLEDLRKRRQLERWRPFLRGGFWRDFLTKYEEANWMHKRALAVSEELRSLPREAPARRALFKAQCNCAYWHGIFGGLYLPHLRHAIYAELLEAEALQPRSLQHHVFDLDRDGQDEAVLRSKGLSLYLTKHGGAIRELDLLEKRFNLTNTLARRIETYHAKLAKAVLDPGEVHSASIHDLILAKEPGLDRHVFQDQQQRWMLQDHFFDRTATCAAFHRNEHRERGDFLKGLYELSVSDTGAVLTRQGSVDGQPVKVIKRITLGAVGLNVVIEVRNLSDQRLEATYANEWNFSLLGGNSPDRYFLLDGEPPEASNLASTGTDTVRSLTMVLEWEGLSLELAFPAPTEVWRHPIETVSMSEAGFERVYQCSGILPVWPLELAPGELAVLGFTLTTTCQN